MKMYLYQIFSSYVYAFTQFMNLPWYFRFVFGVLAISTNQFLRKGGIPFYKLSSEDRISKIELLEGLRFLVFKDFVKFYRSLTVFAFYSFNGVKNV